MPPAESGNNATPRQFGGTLRFGSGSWQSSATMTGSTQVSRASKLGLGLNKGSGLGKGKGSRGLGMGPGLKRHKKIQRDTILGITKGDIKRLARRGGIKRISATIYDDVRMVLKKRLEALLGNIIPLVEHSNRKTVAVTDVIFTLNRMGTPIYGFQPTFDGRHRN